MIIAERYRGPKNLAHGGYACGASANLIDGPAEVTLRLGTPLDTELEVEEFDDGVRVMLGENALALVTPTTLDIDAVEPVGLAAAQAAVAGFPWYEKHPSDGECFACGPKRESGAGLRIFAGPVEGREVVAAPWLPTSAEADADGTVLPEMLIATLDCTAFLGGSFFDPVGVRSSVLGRLRSEVYSRPQVGKALVNVGWFIGRDGRKLDVGSALFTDAGDLIALGRATWIELRRE